jgi:Uma2 family endonuclease
MSTVSVSTTTLLTAEEFAQRLDPGYPEELVRGRVEPMPMPKPRHGEICANAVLIIGGHTKNHDLGRVLGNDTGVVTQRCPDTVRGDDVIY